MMEGLSNDKVRLWFVKIIPIKFPNERKLGYQMHVPESMCLRGVVILYKQHWFRYTKAFVKPTPKSSRHSCAMPNFKKFS